LLLVLCCFFVLDDVVGYNDDNVVAIIYAVAYDHIDGNECL